jgi:phage FluMu protein Com
MATIPVPHTLLDLTCPRCHKMNLLAVVPPQCASSYSEHAVECAHCEKIWEASLPGPIVSGPFPK